MWFPWSDSIKTRLCRFLLHHYIGHYLEEKLSLDQMSIELYAGKGTIHNVALNTETLNDLLDQLNLPFEITEGFIGRVSVGVPWQTLVSSSTVVEVEGLEITVQPKQTCPTATTSMMDSVRNMTSSLVLAQHVMEEEVDTKLEGLEAFAHMIESVLSRVKCSFLNTSVCLQSRDSNINTKLELVIERINYFDESEKDTSADTSFIPTSIAHKVIQLSGISLRVSESQSCYSFTFYTDPDEREQPAPAPQPNVVAKFLGEQEIKIHLKINDQLPGPKLDMECNVGSIHVMLSPHTVHMLCDLILSINTTLTDSRKERAPVRCHKMDNDDFANVEHQLYTNLTKAKTLFPPPEDQGSSDFFYSMDTPNFPSLDLPPLDTELQSIPLGGADGALPAPGSGPGYKKPAKTGVKHTELSQDQIVVQLNVRYIALTLLHQNLTHASVKGELTPPQVTLSNNYFTEIAEVVTNNYARDADRIRSVLNKVCPHDHLFMNCVNTTFRLELMTSAQHIDSNTTLSIVKCEVEEVLYSTLEETNLKTPSIKPVILLDQRETQVMTGSIYHPTSPALNFTSKSISSAEELKTNCTLELGCVSLIADITMYERVGVFHKAPSKRTVHLPTVPGQDLHLPTASMVRQNIYDQVIEDNYWSSEREYRERFNSTATCSNICITFRFPIPDMRPAEHRTWWLPSLRPDYVIMHVENASLSYIKQEGESGEIGAQFIKLNCEYLEHCDADPVSFLQAGVMEEHPQTMPHIKITLNPDTDQSLLVIPTPSSPPPSLDSILHIPESKPSPFARKRVMYESQELIMPGSKPEMAAFESQVREQSRVALDFNIPEVLIYLQDKHFFEVLYNRLLTDLLLWTPACPQVQDNSMKVEQDIFRMCTSTAHRESDSDSEEETSLPSYRAAAPKGGSSWLSLSFNFQQSRVSLNCTVPPSPDQSPLHSNPTGEVLLELINSHIFTVLEHEGDPNTSYFSMYSDTGTLYHGTAAPVTLSSSTLTESSLHSNLDEILFSMPAHLAQFLPPKNPDYGLLTLASRMYFDQAKNIKEITLALSLQDVCHRYLMKPAEENFATQLIEFFSVEDYTVPGYKLPLSVTSLHTHLWNLAVDYRPLYLPWNLLATVQSLGVSSNLALESSVTSLRVLLEDLTLHLAPDSSMQPFSGEGYVKLVELDLFELMIKMLIAPDDKNPQLEVEVKNNMLHVSTCADSCAALRDFLIYCTSEGDMHEPGDLSQSSMNIPRTTRVREHSSSSDIPSLVKSAVKSSDTTSSSPSSTSNLALDLSGENNALPVTQTEPDCVTSDHVTSAYSKHTFTFPDDSPMTDGTVSDIATAVDDVSEDLPMSVKSPYSTLGSVTDAMTSAMEDDDDDDDQFFVVESDLVETMVPKGQFVIKKLVDTVPVLIEDHLSLPEDTDQLKAPPHFPLPISRITIKELSLQWSMFGGNDFPVQSEGSSLPGTPRTDRAHSLSESGNRERRNSQKSPKDQSGRNKSEQMEFLITKMKMRYEQYPVTASQIFRICLILTDLEIRDKMGSSNFNKFLYQYSTDDNPRPSRTPMLCVKTVHSRSEESTEEAIIRVSVLPLRFNIDQDALLFIFTFFNNMSELTPYRRPPSRPPTTVTTTTTPARAPTDHEPLGFGKSSAVVGKATVNMTSSLPYTMTSSTLRADHIPQNLTSSSSVTIGRSSSPHSGGSTTSGSDDSNSSSSSKDPPDRPSSTSPHEETPTFIKAFVFSPEVPIRVDYRGKNIRGDGNMISNPVTNLLIGLAQLNCSELRLKSLCYRQGLLGYSRLAEWATLQWINDIKTSQLPSILGGVGPMHSFIQLFSGIVDLVYLPVQQYREDGRIVKGLQRGANSFTHSTAVSLLQLTGKLFSSIQCVAEVTYDLVSPSQHRKGSGTSIQQPADLREGFVNAYQVVTSDITTRANCIQHAAVYNHSTKGITSAVGGVLREIPPTLLLPFITLPKVVMQLTNGAQNHLKPSTLKEREEKYRS